MQAVMTFFTEWLPPLDELLIWGVAGLAACIGLVALVNALEMLMDSETT